MRPWFWLAVILTLHCQLPGLPQKKRQLPLPPSGRDSHRLFSPCCRYSDLESKHLQADLESMSFPTTSGSAEDIVEGMRESVPLAFQLCVASIDRCLRLTQGTEIQAVVRIIDLTLKDFLTRLKVPPKPSRHQICPSGLPLADLDSKRHVESILRVAIASSCLTKTDFQLKNLYLTRPSKFIVGAFGLLLRFNGSVESLTV